MYIPEWEVEEAIAWNPNLIEVPSNINGLQLVERQKYLKSLGRYIDLLFKNNDKYVVVEVKCNKIDQKSIITEQILEYKKGLSKELRIPEDKVVCILATPEGFSDEVKELCRYFKVLPIKIDENKIIELTKVEDRVGLSLFSEYRKTGYSKILKRRGVTEFGENISDNLLDEIRSLKTWIKYGLHDENAKKRIAALFIKISEKAPICAHEVGTDGNGKLTNNYDMWFWLFYSVMDRRSNAANFVKAKIALEKKGLFRPHRIVQLINEKNEAIAISMITSVLEESGFPLMYDSIVGKEAQPRSVVDATKFMSKYNYDFDKLYDHHFTSTRGDYEATYKSIREDIQNSIYGAGPRIVSQFIRGMVLKGNWNLPLTDNLLLEKCKFNVRFAGKLRLSLIESEETYSIELGKFADEYLNGNRAIISHVLWYVRKRYCDKKIMCNECELAGYCRYFYKTSLEPLDNKNVCLDAFNDL